MVEIFLQKKGAQTLDPLLIKFFENQNYSHATKSVSKFFIKEIHQVNLKISSGIMTDLLREYPNN